MIKYALVPTLPLIETENLQNPMHHLLNILELQLISRLIITILTDHSIDISLLGCGRFLWTRTDGSVTLQFHQTLVDQIGIVFYYCVHIL